MGSFSNPHFNPAAGASVGTIKASAGVLCLLEVRNPNVTEAYLQIFDHASPVVGTTTPVLSFYIPGSGGMDKMFTVPIEFVTAIKYAVTTTPAGAVGPAVGVTLNASCT
jgi:hypothetical protein